MQWVAYNNDKIVVRINIKGYRKIYNQLESDVYSATAFGKSSAIIQDETYTWYFEIFISASEVTNMMNKGFNYLTATCTYFLVGNQCDNEASRIMAAGDKGYYFSNKPNWSIECFSKGWGLLIANIGGWFVLCIIYWALAQT